MPGLRRGRSHPGKEGTPLKIKNGFPRRQTERNGAYRDQVRPPFPTARELNLASCKFVRVGLQMLLLPVRGRRFCHVSHGYRNIIGLSMPRQGTVTPKGMVFYLTDLFDPSHPARGQNKERIRPPSGDALFFIAFSEKPSVLLLLQKEFSPTRDGLLTWASAARILFFPPPPEGGAFVLQHKPATPQDIL